MFVERESLSNLADELYLFILLLNDHLTIDRQQKQWTVIKWMPISLLQQLPHSTNVSSTIRDSLNCDSNDEHTPPPIPTPGWTEGLETRLRLETQASSFFSLFFCSTNDF